MKQTISSNIGKFKSMADFHAAFPDEKSCIKYLERQLWPNSEPVSPYDPTSKVYRRGDGVPLQEHGQELQCPHWYNV